MKTVNILGTEYKILTCKISENEILRKNHWAGCCNECTHEIIIADMSEDEYFPDMTNEEKEVYMKHTLRHEVVHAFLNESGLSANTLSIEGGWAKNEEMVDWIAIQFPKLLVALKSAGAL